MGFCTDGADRAVPRAGAGGREGDGRLRHHPDQVLARGQPRRADPAAREPDRRPAQDLEAVGHGPEVLQPLVRLLAGPATTCSRATDTSWAPWFVAHTDDKKRGRLNIISHLLSQIPYEPLHAEGRQATQAADRPTATSSPTSPLHYVPRSSEPTAIGTPRRRSSHRQTMATTVRPASTGRSTERWYALLARRGRPSGSASTPPTGLRRGDGRRAAAAGRAQRAARREGRSGLAALPRRSTPPTCRSSCSSPPSCRSRSASGARAPCCSC